MVDAASTWAEGEEISDSLVNYDKESEILDFVGFWLVIINVGYFVIKRKALIPSR